MTTPPPEILQATDLIKQGNKTAARLILANYLQTHPDDELAWSCLYSTHTAIDQKINCLDNILRINPSNLNAARQLAELSPSRPASPKPAPFVPQPSSPSSPRQAAHPAPFSRSCLTITLLNIILVIVIFIAAYIFLNNLTLSTLVAIFRTPTLTFTSTIHTPLPTWTTAPTWTPSPTVTPRPTRTPRPSPTVPTPTPMTPGVPIKTTGTGSRTFAIDLPPGKFLVAWSYYGVSAGVPEYETTYHQNELAILENYYNNIMAIYDNQEALLAGQNDALGLQRLQRARDAFTASYNQNVQAENDRYDAVVEAYADHTTFTLSTYTSNPKDPKTLANFSGPGSSGAYIYSIGEAQHFVIVATGSWRVNVSIVK